MKTIHRYCVKLLFISILLLLLSLSAFISFADDVNEVCYDYADAKLSSYHLDSNYNYENPPTVTVFNSLGETLNEDIDYTVAYDSEPFLVGDHSIEVKGNEPYTFDIYLKYYVT